MPFAQFDILGFGAVAVDELLYVGAYPAEEGKVRVRQRIRQCGGLTGTALVAAARLGAKTAYVGLIGGDPLSREVLAGFVREGVDTTYAVRNDLARPAHSTIVVDQRRHTRTIFASADGLLGAAPDRPEAALIRSAKVLLVDHHGMPGTRRAITIAMEQGIPVVGDFERHGGDGFDSVLADVDHLILSEAFAKECAGANTAPEAAVRLWSNQRRIVIITCGDKGGWYYAGPRGGAAEPQCYPAYQVEVVDTTGCGDVFHGAYAARLAAGEQVNERLKWASATAALKASRHGGQSGIPRAAEVREFLAGQL
jgi:ribokinase